MKTIKMVHMLMYGFFGFLILSAFILLILKNNHYETRIYPVQNGYGYEIVVQNKVVIHQNTLPVVGQGKPIKTERQAQQLATLVIRKLQNGTSPTINRQELKQLKIID